MAVLELATSVSAFYGATGEVFRANNPRTTNTKDNRMKEALLRLPYARVTWLCSIFLLGYVGAEVALGGWIVKFMLEVRDGADFASGMTATGFWMGITVGRITLGFVTPRLGEKLAIAVRSFLLFLSQPLPFPPQPFTHRITQSTAQLLTLPDLPPDNNGPGTPLLARTLLLRLRHRRLAARLLPRPLIPRRRGRGHEAAASPPARERHRLRGCVWRERGRHFPVRSRRYCAG